MFWCILNINTGYLSGIFGKESKISAENFPFRNFGQKTQHFQFQ